MANMLIAQNELLMRITELEAALATKHEKRKAMGERLRPAEEALAKVNEAADEENGRALAAITVEIIVQTTTHPKSPAREHKPPNKHYVKKALEANALVPPPTSPPKGHRPRSRTRRSQSKSREKPQDSALESLNYTPGTAPETSPTTLGLIPQKNRAASAERPESPPAKKPAPAGQTPPTKVSWAVGPPSLKSSLPDSSYPPSSHNHPNVPLTSIAHNCTKQELQDALTKLRDSLKAEVTNMIT
ncbi:hypothetical protein HPB51_000457 [Rhipicephalus microplus]|uniref:Uncharacterized protein n=1 Tax=Rhipicephalus microplus TaxID=6941 RepID=A0A9J6EKW5_RHIMP|nr:hypothetical protein HPB51_000457 [Rhipicephalus microplus]